MLCYGMHAYKNSNHTRSPGWATGYRFTSKSFIKSLGFVRFHSTPFSLKMSPKRS